jgi:hypothetical protein
MYSSFDFDILCSLLPKTCAAVEHESAMPRTLLPLAPDPLPLVDFPQRKSHPCIK